MAKIINTSYNRRNIRISTDDVLAIIHQYQIITKGCNNYSEIRAILNKNSFYLPEDL